MKILNLLPIFILLFLAYNSFAQVSRAPAVEPIIEIEPEFVYEGKIGKEIKGHNFKIANDNFWKAEEKTTTTNSALPIFLISLIVLPSLIAFSIYRKNNNKVFVETKDNVVPFDKLVERRNNKKTMDDSEEIFKKAS